MDANTNTYLFHSEGNIMPQWRFFHVETVGSSMYESVESQITTASFKCALRILTFPSFSFSKCTLFTGTSCTSLVTLSASFQPFRAADYQKIFNLHIPSGLLVLFQCRFITFISTQLLCQLPTHLYFSTAKNVNLLAFSFL